MQQKTEGEVVEIDNTEDVDFQQAVQNLTDVLIDQEKFALMAKKFYEAMDEDNLGYLYVEVVLNFIKSFMRGQVGEKISTDFEFQHEALLQQFQQDNEDGECSFEDLSKLLYQLLKDQVGYLQ